MLSWLTALVAFAGDCFSQEKWLSAILFPGNASTVSELPTWLHSALGAVSAFHKTHVHFLAACILFLINLSIKFYDFWFLVFLPSEAWLGHNAIALFFEGNLLIFFVENSHQGNNPFWEILSPPGKSCSCNFE